MSPIGKLGFLVDEGMLYQLIPELCGCSHYIFISMNINGNLFPYELAPYTIAHRLNAVSIGIEAKLNFPSLK